MEEALNGVIDVVDQARDYGMQLEESLEVLDKAKEQILQTASKTTTILKDHFESIRTAINNALDVRLAKLLTEVETIKEKEVKPILQCEDLIKTGLSGAADLMKEAKVLLEGNHEENLVKMGQLKSKANKLELNSIPEVPSTLDVAFIYADLPEDLDSILTKPVEGHGRVFPRSQVQITDVQERPGALLIKWDEVPTEDIYHQDIHEFKLEFSYGTNTDITSNSTIVWHTAYQGQNRSKLIPISSINKPYTFQVYCREEEGKWNHVSVPVVAMTTIPHHTWQDCSNEYSLSSENKTATKVTPDVVSVLYSNTASYTCGHTIKFKIIQAGEVSDEYGIGISVDCDDKQTLNRPGALFYSMAGKVFVDGQEMKMKLPPLTKGSSLTIETEEVEKGKIRTTLETGDRLVSYDWKLPQKSNQTSGLLSNFGMGGNANKTNLYFGIVLQNEDWRVCVE